MSDKQRLIDVLRASRGETQSTSTKTKTPSSQEKSNLSWMPDLRKLGVGQLLMVVGGAMLVTSLLSSGRSSKKKRSEQHISGCSCGAQTVKKSGLSQWIELGKFLAPAATMAYNYFKPDLERLLVEYLVKNKKKS